MPIATPALCRDCLHPFAGPGPCPACHSPRVARHPELWQLSIAHMDCDAFYASVEKRDNPALRDVPIIVGDHGHGAQLIQAADYMNPLPHVLMLTAIVVSIATTGVALAVLILVYRRYQTLDENEIIQIRQAKQEAGV